MQKGVSVDPPASLQAIGATERHLRSTMQRVNIIMHTIRNAALSQPLRFCDLKPFNVIGSFCMDILVFHGMSPINLSYV
jgi:hypothetical protein